MFVFLSLLVFAYAQDNQANLSVNTTQGVVIGSRATDGNYYTFYGLHYGGNTAGENRFKAPTPPPTYPGEYYAIDNKVICAQPSPRGLIGVEDCLVLNVFTQNATGNRPVIVWLESEEYTTTRQELYSFNKLVEHDVVLVSISYRLSIFGFLCLGVPDAPGNAGIKDAIQALKWIQQNIAGFGGDPNNVAILAQGSGAAMAELITLSPLSQNLLHKVIAISGSALSPWAVAYEPVKYAKSLGEKLSYTDKSNAELAKLLASTDLSILTPALNDFEFFNNTPLFAPCIEEASLGAGSVLTDSPINLIRNGNYNDVPYIAVFVDREGTLRAEQAAVNDWLGKMDKNFTDFIQVDLKFESESNKSAEAQKIRDFYFAQRVIAMDTIEDFLDYQGDTLVAVSVIRGVAERSKTSKSPVRLMEFAYRGTRNSDWSYPQIPLKGARHGSLLNYLFDFDLRPSDAAVQDAIIRRLVAFVKVGDPNPTNYVNPGIPWNTYTRESTIALRISGDDEILAGRSFQEEARVNIHQQRMDFWNSMYEKYYNPPQPTSSAEGLLCLSLLLTLSQILIKLL
ncbi:venom carboxylesterase-6 [Pieris rapae]|uniref:venom carboxylesterase-6 n=1 Tax=Pieris rapae TaxID=64459 RepID=UPI001E27CD90|nr:venom carboxylesterase-6 [Pieris rapae]